MPVSFLTPEQITQYGHYAGEPTPAQLAKYFHLDDGDRQIITALCKPYTQLGFAVQLGTIRFLGAFLTDLKEAPAVVIKHMAEQLQIDIEVWLKYGKRSQRRHKKKIRRLYRYENFHKSRLPFLLMRQLYARASLTQESHLILFDYTTAWLVQHKMLLPGARVLERWVARIVSRAQQRLWQRLVKLVTGRQRSQLQSLLIVEDGERFSRLELLR